MQNRRVTRILFILGKHRLPKSGKSSKMKQVTRIFGILRGCGRERYVDGGSASRPQDHHQHNVFAAPTLC